MGMTGAIPTAPCLRFKGVVSVVIAVVGKTHGNKKKIVQYLEKYSNGQFKRLVPYTTRKDKCSKPHTYMSEGDFSRLQPDEIFHCVEPGNGYKYFVLTSQLKEDRGIIYVVDDPKGVAKLDSLGVPYAIVYVGCSKSDIEGRALIEDDVSATKARLNVTGNRLRAFKKSGNYSMYINTSKLATKYQKFAVGMFIDKVLSWLETRKEDELCMPLVAMDMNEATYKFATGQVAFD